MNKRLILDLLRQLKHHPQYPWTRRRLLERINQLDNPDPVTTADLAEAIGFCKDRNWLSTRFDDYKEELHIITTAGENELTRNP